MSYTLNLSNLSNNQTTVKAAYPLPEDMIRCMEEAKVVFGVQEQHIVNQALKEFFEKHGILHRSCT